MNKIWFYIFSLIIFTACNTMPRNQNTLPATTPPVKTISTETSSAPTPRFRPVCGPSNGDHFVKEDDFGDGYISRVPLKAVANTSQVNIVHLLVTQWFEHYKTQNQSASAAIKDYSIEGISLEDPFCEPFFQIVASVKFSGMKARARFT